MKVSDRTGNPEIFQGNVFGLTCLVRHLKRLTITKGPLALPSCVHLILQTAVNHSKLKLQADKVRAQAHIYTTHTHTHTHTHTTAEPRLVLHKSPRYMT